MSNELKHDRRRFLATATKVIAAAELGMMGTASAQTGERMLAMLPAIKPESRAWGQSRNPDSAAPVRQSEV